MNGDPTDLYEIVSERLDQLSGVLLAIANTFGDKGDECMLPAEHLDNALSAAIHLLDDARKAFRDMPAPRGESQ